MKKRLSNTFFINTLVIILSNFLIKLLGLANKIIITRNLGTSGMSLYVLSFPTIMLFVGIAGFSLNITISKLIAEAIASKKYSPRKIIKYSFSMVLILSLFIMFIYLLLLKTITNVFLKNPDLYYPLLCGAPLILLVGISDGLKGYFTGIKKVNITSVANLIEQIGRTSFSIIFLLAMIPHGVIVATSFCLLALSFGELCTIVFTIIKIKKYPIIDYENTSGEKEAIISNSIPNTLSRLLGNFTFFLEPILYTFILNKIGYEINDIQTNYTIIDAYVIPLLTFISFIPQAISFVMIPYISEAHALNKEQSIHYYLRKSLTFTIIPVFILIINLFLSADSFMFLIYKTTEGSHLIKYIVFFFIFFYLQIPLNACLQGLGKAKVVFFSSTFINFLRTILLVVFCFNKNLNFNALVLSITIEVIIGFIINFTLVKKITKFKINLGNLFSLFMIFIISFCVGIFLKSYDINYLIIFTVTSFILLSLSFFMDFLWIESMRSIFKKRIKLK